MIVAKLMLHVCVALATSPSVDLKCYTQIIERGPITVERATELACGGAMDYARQNGLVVTLCVGEESFKA